MVAFSGAHVVVTGGTGALGSAVIAALRQAGAVCHVTNLVAAELDHFSHKGDTEVHVTSGVDLADEAAVQRFYKDVLGLDADQHHLGRACKGDVGDGREADRAAILETVDAAANRALRHTQLRCDLPVTDARIHGEEVNDASVQGIQ